MYSDSTRHQHSDRTEWKEIISGYICDYLHVIRLWHFVYSLCFLCEYSFSFYCVCTPTASGSGLSGLRILVSFSFSCAYLLTCLTCIRYHFRLFISLTEYIYLAKNPVLFSYRKMSYYDAMLVVYERFINQSPIPCLSTNNTLKSNYQV